MVLLLESATTAPPEGAGPVRVTVATDEVPPVTAVGLKAILLILAAFTVKVAVFVF